MIGLVPDQILTRLLVLEATHRDGMVVADPGRDILKLVVVERHRATGRIGIGFVQGFGLREGALASSVAHDSHNIIAVGSDDGDLFRAVKAVEEMGGGLAAVLNGEVLAKLPLPIAGLMSDRPLGEVARGWQELRRAARAFGSIPEEPFMVLSFLALPVIPELKLTDRGLVDVNRFEHVPLFAGGRRAHGATGKVIPVNSIVGLAQQLQGVLYLNRVSRLSQAVSHLQHAAETPTGYDVRSGIRDVPDLILPQFQRKIVMLAEAPGTGQAAAITRPFHLHDFQAGNHLQHGAGMVGGSGHFLAQLLMAGEMDGDLSFQRLFRFCHMIRPDDFHHELSGLVEFLDEGIGLFLVDLVFHPAQNLWRTP